MVTLWVMQKINRKVSQVSAWRTFLCTATSLSGCQQPNFIAVGGERNLTFLPAQHQCSQKRTQKRNGNMINSPISPSGQTSLNWGFLLVSYHLGKYFHGYRTMANAMMKSSTHNKLCKQCHVRIDVIAHTQAKCHPLFNWTLFVFFLCWREHRTRIYIKVESS